MNKKIMLILMILAVGSVFLSCSHSIMNQSSDKSLQSSFDTLALTNELSLSESTYKIDVRENTEIKKPEFVEQNIFDESIELGIVDIKVVNAMSYSQKPTPYGWTYSRYIKGQDIQNYKDIIIDKDSHFKNSGNQMIIDSKNMLGYFASENTLYCSRLSKEEEKLLWSVEFNEAKLCATPFDMSIIIYNTNELALIDTEKLVISRYFVLNESMQIESIIPSGTNLWIFAIDKIELQSSKPYKNLRRNAYVVNSKNEVFKFQMPFMYVKEKDDEMMLGGNKTYCIVDNELNAKMIDLYSLHNDIYPVENTTAYKFIVGEFEVGKSSEQYFVDLKNPETLLKKPAELVTLNLLEGAERDYCYRIGSMCYGYNIKDQKTTWKIDVSDVPADIVPIYSTQSGILFSGIDSYSKNKIIRAYGKKALK